MKKNWSTGKIVAVILGGFAYLLILGISLIASIFYLSHVLAVMSEDEDSFYEEEYEDYDDEEDAEEEDSREETRKSRKDREEEYAFDDDGDYDLWDEEAYYEFGNAIEEDLPYQVSFQEVYRDDFSKESGKGTAVMEFSYPVITGQVDNLEAINAAIYGEIEDTEAYIESNMPYLIEGDYYDYSGEAFVTYMSEEILSVVYVEYGYLNEGFMESYVKCFNVDMQTGMILKNTHLLDIDDDFSIEFRERCERQNGEIDDLSYFLDQDITDYLTDDSTLIIFYTPLGMEVGFNYYEGWVTVTYSDYEKYAKQF